MSKKHSSSSKKTNGTSNVTSTTTKRTKQEADLILPEETFQELFKVAARKIDPKIKIQKNAIREAQTAVEMEVLYILRDAYERKTESGSGGPSARNIVGAIVTYGRYRDDDISMIYSIVNTLMAKPLKS